MIMRLKRWVGCSSDISYLYWPSSRGTPLEVDASARIAEKIPWMRSLMTKKSKDGLQHGGTGKMQKISRHPR